MSSYVVVVQLYFQLENVSFLRLDLRFAGPFNVRGLRRIQGKRRLPAEMLRMPTLR